MDIITRAKQEDEAFPQIGVEYVPTIVARVYAASSARQQDNNGLEPHLLQAVFIARQLQVKEECR